MDVDPSYGYESDDDDRHSYPAGLFANSSVPVDERRTVRAQFARPNNAPPVALAHQFLEEVGLDTYQPNPEAPHGDPEWTSIPVPEPPPKPRYKYRYTVEGGWEKELLPEDQWLPVDPRKIPINPAHVPEVKFAGCVQEFIRGPSLKENRRREAEERRLAKEARERQARESPMSDYGGGGNSGGGGSARVMNGMSRFNSNNNNNSGNSGNSLNSSGGGFMPTDDDDNDASDP